ncbi:MAG: SAM-dependent methyltransferase [Bacteroidetes bacterium 4572_77]|nr:MAG: SAM-dependent methyltransferase [Bacteroidetes bacterium 4572_77]
MAFSSLYWDKKYQSQQTGWDMGYASPPIVAYFEQVEHKNKRILIPGAGNAWEAEYLWKQGFENVFVMDYSKEALKNFRKRVPQFPLNQLIEADFFQCMDTYDIVVEQTFFSSLLPEQRQAYVQKILQLLKTNGRLIGLLFNHQFHKEYPPYGGSLAEYEKLFSPYFHIKVLKTAYNSIKPRANREVFLNLKKR